MKRRRKSEPYTIEFSLFVMIFAIGLFIGGAWGAVIFTFIAVFGYAAYKINDTQKQRKAFKEWFHNNKGMENIEEMSPLKFEEFVNELYKQLGYTTKMTPRSGDEGIDVLAKKDGRWYAIQVKKTAKPVGSPVIQTLTGSMVHARISFGICVSASGFTRDAKRIAYGKNIALIDNDGLAKLLKELV